MENFETATAATATPKARRTRKVAPVANSRIVTATLPRRRVRVQFKIGSRVVFTKECDSRNILTKIVQWARGEAKGMASGAKAMVHQQDGKKWVPIKD